MSWKPISQREARRWKKVAEELQAKEKERANRWVDDWPGGVHIATFSMPNLRPILKTARALGCAVVVVPDGDGDPKFYGIRLCSRG